MTCILSTSGLLKFQIAVATLSKLSEYYNQLRSVGDYTKRVGKRLANVERRIAAGGTRKQCLVTDLR
ncbi:BEM_HP_G0080740.mRNA.1.CDS.1 [Saccharomyces cerevisiae]|nr:BEM_HP_G0080740.mRNA.1.CDS.1 [Saccharomyces cerevisiae]CAI6992437.1 BEM_HP_G0080740.mRNA.1.CDS.1 [Saccharomyces cerevisiae]